MSAARRDVVIIASGGANIASLQYALERLGSGCEVSAAPARIKRASHVVLPGVGAAGDAMQRLRERELDQLIPVLEQPVLGICLGMQLLFEHSEEGQSDCLGIMPGRAQRFSAMRGRPVPHMGWNTLHPVADNPLLEGIKSGDHAYFVHSYALPVSQGTIATCEYGTSFSACVQHRNFFGAQFHPERSAAVGARVLRNFLDIA